MESNKIIGYSAEDFVNASKGLSQCGFDLNFENISQSNIVVKKQINLKPKKRFNKTPSVVTNFKTTKYGVLEISPEKQRLYNSLRYFGKKMK